MSDLIHIFPPGSHFSYRTRRRFCKRGHELTDDNIVWKNNKRSRACKTCVYANTKTPSYRKWMAAYKKLWRKITGKR